jgi:hypothetical protein
VTIPNDGVHAPSDETLRVKLERLSAAATYSPGLYETAFTVALESQGEGTLAWLCNLLQAESTPQDTLAQLSPIVTVCVMQQLTQGLHASLHAQQLALLPWLRAAVLRLNQEQDMTPAVKGAAGDIRGALAQKVKAATSALVVAHAAGVQEGTGGAL